MAVSAGEGQEEDVEEEEPHLLVYTLEEKGGQAFGGGGSFDSNSSSRSEEEEDSEEMDGALWSALPADTLERVLLLLPLRGQLKFRAVCTRWRALLSSPRFREQSGALAFAAAPPVVCAYEYKPGRRLRRHLAEAKNFAPRDLGPLLRARFKAHRLGLGFVPARFAGWRRGMERAVPSHSGMLCVYDADWRRGCVRVCVVNPVSQSWREVPPLVVPGAGAEEDWDVVMVAERRVPAGGGFRVVVVWNRGCGADDDDDGDAAAVAGAVGGGGAGAGVGGGIGGGLQQQQQDQDRSSSPWYIGVYSSDTNAWSTARCEPALRNLCWRNCVVCDDFLYVAAKSEVRRHRISDGKCVARAPEPHHAAGEPGAAAGYKDFFLVEQRGAVLWVDFIVPGMAESERTCGVWRLDEATMRWDEIAVSPRALIDKLKAPYLEGKAKASDSSASASDFRLWLKKVVAAGDFLFLTVCLESWAGYCCWTHLVALHLGRLSWHILVYDHVSHPLSDEFYFLEPSPDLLV